MGLSGKPNIIKIVDKYDKEIKIYISFETSSKRDQWYYIFNMYNINYIMLYDQLFKITNIIYIRRYNDIMNHLYESKSQDAITTQTTSSMVIIV